jgi:uracil-DNA glycosylase
MRGTSNVMYQVTFDNTFDSWRDRARALLSARVAPDEVIWDDGTCHALALGVRFEGADAGGTLYVPKDFVSLARRAACHRDPARWGLLYRVLYRIAVGGETRLLEIAVDEDVHQLELMRKQVNHDAHRMEAFVRFRKVADGVGQEHFVAWHRPDHYVVRLTAPFFRERFASMRWSILTPDESVSWDGTKLTFGKGVARSEAPSGDELETLWKTYYGHTFNPARANVKVMTQHLPRRYWDCLPETQEIDALLREAPQRVEQMIMASKSPSACPTTSSAADFIPREGKLTLPLLAKAAAGCTGCGLYCNATQTVFGAGPASAIAMFIGEQPGDQEDRAGKPFVGPAGQMLDEVLEEVGIDRSLVYVTNTVKHFKFEPRGTRRIHSKPNAREITACMPWLEAEAGIIKPQVLVCLGATAAQALMGPGFRITKDRGTILTHDWAPWWMATYHPSALLRVPDPAMRDRMRSEFATDLKKVAKRLREIGV